jgi:hypothetical protein
LSPPPTCGYRGHRGWRSEGSRAGGRRHWIEEATSPSPPPSPYPSSTPEPKPVDRFKFGVTLNYGADPTSIRLPHKFGKVVNIKTNQVVLRVHGGTTGLWTMELLFHRTGTPYLASGWRRFCQQHEIVAGHFIVFNYDDEHQIMATVFDETMCHRHYVATARGRATISSSSNKDDE